MRSAPSTDMQPVRANAPCPGHDRRGANLQPLLRARETVLDVRTVRGGPKPPNQQRVWTQRMRIMSPHTTEERDSHRRSILRTRCAWPQRKTESEVRFLRKSPTRRQPLASQPGLRVLRRTDTQVPRRVCPLPTDQGAHRARRQRSTNLWPVRWMAGGFPVPLLRRTRYPSQGPM